MITHVEHIGIAVADRSLSIELFTRLLGKEPYKTEEVESEQVNTVFFEVGQTKLELLEATGEGSAIARHLAARGEGVHHIALATDDLDAELNRLTASGFELIAPPKLGADGKRIVFLHPKGTNRVLVELCADAPPAGTV
jgi:methylmalonyl-CoA/ethylmalonyl-CoA epimerase